MSGTVEPGRRRSRRSGLDLNRVGFSFGGQGIPSLIAKHECGEEQAVTEWGANAEDQAGVVVTR